MSSVEAGVDAANEKLYWMMGLFVVLVIVILVVGGYIIWRMHTLQRGIIARALEKTERSVDSLMPMISRLFASKLSAASPAK